MILKDRNAGLYEVTIEMGTFFEAEDGDFYIKFRGPYNDEWLKLQTVQSSLLKGGVKLKGKNVDDDEGTEVNMEAMEGFSKHVLSLMKSCIIEHNFEVEGKDGEPKPMNNDEVWKEISKRPDCVIHITNAWLTSLPFTKGKNG
jgi:hypothetical protein